MPYENASKHVNEPVSNKEGIRRTSICSYI